MNQEVKIFPHRSFRAKFTSAFPLLLAVVSTTSSYLFWNEGIRMAAALMALLGLVCCFAVAGIIRRAYVIDGTKIQDRDGFIKRHYLICDLANVVAVTYQETYGRSGRVEFLQFWQPTGDTARAREFRSRLMRLGDSLDEDLRKEIEANTGPLERQTICLSLIKAGDRRRLTKELHDQGLVSLTERDYPMRLLR